MSGDAAAHARRCRQVARQLLACADALSQPTEQSPTGSPVCQEAARWMREAAVLLDPLLDDDVYHALTL